MSKTNKFLLGTFIGSCIGMIIGLIYAPQKGEKTRREVIYHINSYITELKNILDYTKSRKNTPSEAKQRGIDIISQAKEKALQLEKEINTLIQESYPRKTKK